MTSTLEIMVWMAWLLCGYYGSVNLIYGFLTYLAVRETLDHHHRLKSLRHDRTLSTRLCPPISILVPARNEEAGILESVTSLLALNYPEIEVVVINDGSTDNTLGVLREHFRLVVTDILHVNEIPTSPVKAIYASATERRLLVLDKVSCGRKADALNAGLNAASSPYVCAIDGDALLEPDALRRIMAPALNDPRHVIASGGIVRAANGCVVAGGIVTQVRMPHRLIEAMQVVEYLRSFLIGRQGWARLGMLLIISGAFGVFRRDQCRAIGGFRTSAIGEDMDLIVRLHRHARDQGGKYKVAFVPDPVCWTEVPSTYKALGWQRARWQNGLADVLYRNRDMILNPRYGSIGMLAMPYQWLFECFAPLIEVAGWGATVVAGMSGLLDCRFFCAVMLANYLFSVLISVGAVLIEELVYRRYNQWSDLWRLVGCCFVEPLFYRPLNTMWRIRGLWHFVARRNLWQLLPRSGLAGRIG